jgi:hypothetical protein
METIIYAKVRDYLIDHVGELTAPGAPVYDGASRQWHVPVLCKTPQGILIVGDVVANEAGDLISVPEKEQMLRLLEAQISRLPLLVFGDRETLERVGAQVVQV